MKSLLFLSLYIVAGAAGWSVYHYTLDNDGAATMDIAAIVPASLKSDHANNVQRWQDETGKWQYGSERPKDLNAKMGEKAANYVDELNALKALPVVANEMARMKDLSPPSQSTTERGWLQKATGTVASILPGNG